MAEYVLSMTGEAVNAALTKAQTDVSFSQSQSLTNEQKAIARNNIGAMETKSVIEYTEQSLTNEQKAIARNNIGAIEISEVNEIRKITGDMTPIESLSNGVYTLDGTGGTLMFDSSGETFVYGTVIISNDLDSGIINWIVVGRDVAWNYGVFLGQTIRTGKFWLSTYQVIPDFGELLETIGGKSDKPIYIKNITTYEMEWQGIWFDPTYPYVYQLDDNRITADMVATPYYSIADEATGNYAQHIDVVDGQLILYAKESRDITIPLIKCERTT